MVRFCFGNGKSMNIEPFHKEDIATFLELAGCEGWLVDPWEFDFLLSTFPQGCLCVRDGSSGKGIGFVTSLKHERSGWIGNLIVSPDCRGQGIGEALFLRAFRTLRDSGADTCWLTASKQGQSLYEKYGFTAVDSIIRWTGTGRQRHTIPSAQTNFDSSEQITGYYDCQVWGDRRDTLLAATIRRGTLLCREQGFLVIQSCGDAIQLGPFSALDNNTAEQLFDAALGKAPLGTKICLDAPASNRSAQRMFNRRMQIAGTTELMYAGKKPDFRPKYLFGLATMGSCG